MRWFLCLLFVAAMPAAFSFVPLARTKSESLRNQNLQQRCTTTTSIRTVSIERSNRRRWIHTKALEKDDAELTDDTPSEDPSVSSSWLWTLCLPLWLVYISNQWSRSSIYYLVDFSDQATPLAAMNVDIGFDQVQYGLLASVAFTTLFAAASLGAGVAADRLNRKLLTTASAASWTVAVLATAQADSFEAVLAARIAMGLACAFSTPTAYTLIRDRVPDNRQALASSIYGTGVALASGLASLTLLLDRAVGWRYALDGVAGFGVLTVLLASVVLPDDEKEDLLLPAEEKKDNTKVVEEEVGEQRDILSEAFADVSQVLSTSRRVQLIFLASFLRFCSGLCIGVWSAPYYRMVFSDYQSEYALSQAVISAVLASLSGLLGGAAADWLSSSEEAEDPVGRRLWVPVVGSLLAAPTWYFAVQTDASFETAMLWLAAEYFVAECWFGPTISTLQASVGPRTGGTAQGMFTLTGAIANLAPSVLGFLYGQQQGTGAELVLSNLLVGGVCFGYLSSAICFALAAQATPNALEKAERRS